MTGSRWAINVQRCRATLYPGSKDHVAQSKRVIRVKMREEHSIESWCRLAICAARRECFYTFSTGCCCAANDSCTGVEEISDGINDYRDGWTKSLWVRNWRTRSEHYDLRSR